MIVYRDRTFCPYYTVCIHSPHDCDRGATPELFKKAKDCMLPVMVYSEKPKCFSEKDFTKIL